MAESFETSHRRAKIAGFVAILIGVSLIGLSIWGGPIFSTGADEEMANPDMVWLLHFICGAAAVAAVGLAQNERRMKLARTILAVTAIALLVALAGFFDIGVRAVLTVIAPALILLATSFFIGPLAPTSRLAR
jgi:hypothetical protein